MTNTSQNTNEPSKRELLEFEKEKFQKELDYKKLALDVEATKEKFDFIKSPLALAILGGIVTILVNSVANYYSSDNTIKLEKEKLQSELIKKYLEVPDSIGRVENLRFLVASGLVPNYSAQISAYLDKNPDVAPQTVPTASAVPATTDWRSFGSDNIVSGDVLKRVQLAGEALVVVRTGQSVREWQTCTGFFVNDRTIATIGYCVPGDMAAGSPGLRDIMLEGITQDSATSTKIQSVKLHGEGSSDHQIAILTLSQPVKGRQFLKVREQGPKVGDRLIMPFLKAGTSDFSASLDDECTVNSLDEGSVITYRCDGDLGSAGAPLASFATGEVVGVHSWSGEKARFGIRVNSADVM